MYILYTQNAKKYENEASQIMHFSMHLVLLPFFFLFRGGTHEVETSFFGFLPEDLMGFSKSITPR